MAPNPRRFTVRSPPTSIVPAAPAVICEFQRHLISSLDNGFLRQGTRSPDLNDQAQARARMRARARRVRLIGRRRIRSTAFRRPRTRQVEPGCPPNLPGLGRVTLCKRDDAWRPRRCVIDIGPTASKSDFSGSSWWSSVMTAGTYGSSPTSLSKMSALFQASDSKRAVMVW